MGKKTLRFWLFRGKSGGYQAVDSGHPKASTFVQTPCGSSPLPASPPSRRIFRRGSCSSNGENFLSQCLVDPKAAAILAYGVLRSDSILHQSRWFQLKPCKTSLIPSMHAWIALPCLEKGQLASRRKNLSCPCLRLMGRSHYLRGMSVIP